MVEKAEAKRRAELDYKVEQKVEMKEKMIFFTFQMGWLNC